MSQVNIGLARMLDNYLVGCWASGTFSRRLVRTSNIFVGNHHSTNFNKAFRAVWLKSTNRRVEDKDLIIGLFPNGLMIYNSNPVRHSLSPRAYNLFSRWLYDNTTDLERSYRLDGVDFRVRKIRVPVFDIATRGMGSNSRNGSFAEHLVENLATSEE